MGSNQNTTWVASIDGITLKNPLRNPYPDGVLVPPASLAERLAVGENIRISNPANVADSYTQHWNFTIQQALLGSAALTLAYAGSGGVRLPLSKFFNHLRPDNLKLGTALTTQVPNPFFGLVRTGTLSSATVAQFFQVLPTISGSPRSAAVSYHLAPDSGRSQSGQHNAMDDRERNDRAPTYRDASRRWQNVMQAGDFDKTPAEEWLRLAVAELPVFADDVFVILGIAPRLVIRTTSAKSEASGPPDNTLSLLSAPGLPCTGTNRRARS